MMNSEINNHECYFIKNYRIVCNQVIEDIIPETKKASIKVKNYLQTQNFTHELKKIVNLGGELEKYILSTLKYSLAESIFIRQSLYIRYLLKTIFNVKDVLNK
jgi:hypothetical protein